MHVSIEVGVLRTGLKMPDNVKIIMSNSSIMGVAISNISAHSTRRVDLVVGVGYCDDLNKVR